MSEHATDQAVQVSTEGDVVVVRLDDGKANALSHGIIDAVAAALDDAALAKAMVLIGREGKFSAGFDLSVMTSGPQQARDLLEAGANLAMQAYLSPVPVVFGVTGHALAMGFLNATNPQTIKLMRAGMMEFGFKAQRLAHKAAKALGLIQDSRAHPTATVGAPTIKTQVIHFLNRPMPGNLPKRTSRALLDIEDDKVIPVIRNPQKTTEDSDAVFYFPGCGSERLFSQVGLATQAMLYEIGATTVLPPGYLCCGYPQTAAGEEVKGQKITTDNRVLFHRVANTLNYLDIRTVIVSCGTCMDQLQKYQFEKIFPGCRLLDIHEYLMEKGVKLEGVEGTRYMYHDPCHTPMKAYAPLQVTSSLMGQDVPLTDRCCGDAGSFAYSRPDVATQVKFRKQEEIEKGAASLRADGFGGKVKILTSCPACLQGLSRFDDDAGTRADYIVVEVAKHLLGENWASQYVDRANNGGIERVLL